MKKTTIAFLSLNKLILVFLLLAMAALNACKKTFKAIDLEEKSLMSLLPDNDVTKWKGITLGGSWQKWGGGVDRGPYFAAGVSSDIDDITTLGADWVRLAFKVGESIDSTIDPKVEAALEAGANILMRYTKGAPLKTYGTDIEETINENYLKDVVDRYKDVIKYWEIENEPNLEQYWDLGGRVGEGTTSATAPYNIGVKKYVQHLQRSYNAIKSVDPTAKVLLGGLSSYKFLTFLDRVRVEGGYNYVDELNLHPYDSRVSSVINILNQFKTSVNTWPAPHKSKPIWITEIGFHAHSTWTTPGLVADESTKAKYLTDVMYALLNNMSSIRPIFWYNLHEPSCSNGYGLTNKCVSGSTLTQTNLAAYSSFQNLSYTTPPGSTVKTVPFTEDFTSEAIGVEPASWFLLRDLNTNGSTEVYPSTTNRTLKVTDNNSAGIVGGKIKFQPQTDTVTITFRFNENNTNSWNRYKILCNGLAPIELVTSYINSANRISYLDATNQRISMGVVSANTWYEVKIKANVTTQLYEIYLNNVLQASNIPFKLGADQLDAFEVQSGTSYTGVTIYVDDLSVN